MPYITVDELRVASPCSSTVWSKEKNEPFARHCKTCEKSVYNLSLMTLDEANDLIREKEGKLCISLYHGLNGKVLTADAPVGFRAFRRKYLKVRASVLGIVLGLWGLITGTTSCTTVDGIYGSYPLPPNFKVDINRKHQDLRAFGINDTMTNEIYINAPISYSDSSSIWILLDSTERAPGTYENHRGVFEAGGYKDSTGKYLWYNGELKIASIDSGHASGTFWFNAERTTPTADIVVVTNGNFDVPIYNGKIVR